MLIFTADENYQKMNLVDSFSSFIWTDRFNSHGDFKLVMSDVKRGRELIEGADFLVNTESDRLMMIESVLEERKDGVKLTVSGRSFEALLKHRHAIRYHKYENKAWKIVDVVENVPFHIVNGICINGDGLLGQNSVISDLSAEIYDENPDPYWVTDHVIRPGTVYERLLEFCPDWREIGFRIKNQNASGLLFQTYKGVDRSFWGELEERDQVTFSTKMGTLSDASHLWSRESLVNSLIVDGSNNALVAAWAAPQPPSGIDYKAVDVREAYIDIDSNIDQRTFDNPNSDLAYAFREGARSDFDQYGLVDMVEGKVHPSSPYVYGEDYFLGDKVNVEFGENMSRKTISEYIWVEDATGSTSYPAFSNQ